IFGAAFAPDGHHVMFVRASGPHADVLLKDLDSGSLTALLPVDSFGAAPVFFPDGHSIVYASINSRVILPDGTQVALGPDVFIKDLDTGVITPVEVTFDGARPDNFLFPDAVSRDGTKVAFEAAASNLVAGDTNGFGDVFVKDLATGAMTRISVAQGG